MFQSKESLYQRTINISEAAWSSAVTKTYQPVSSILDCAHQCSHGAFWFSEPQNAFKYLKESQYCECGQVGLLRSSLMSHQDNNVQLTFLEDSWPHPGVRVFVTTEAARSLPMMCRGGHHCCQREAPCSAGEGDCREDRDCQPGLECGAEGSCVDIFGWSLGLWGPEDRCCKWPCSSDQPCTVGQVRKPFLYETYLDSNYHSLVC